MTPQRIERLAPFWVIVTLVAVGTLLFVAAGVYLSEPARHLPAFFPGHTAGSGRRHTKHAALAIVLGLVTLAVAWLGSGRKRRRWDE
jgi:hypothetical protein